MRLESTSGQSTGSVFIAMIGKTTDFISNNSLVLPVQYVIMVYFSSSVAYINGLQVAWYYGNGDDFRKNEGQGRYQQQLHDIGRENISVETIEGGYNSCNESSKSDENFSSRERLSSKQPMKTQSIFVFVTRCTCLIILSVLLLICVAGFTWNIGSYYGLFAPVAIALVLGSAKLYFKYCTESEYSL